MNGRTQFVSFSEKCEIDGGRMNVQMDDRGNGFLTLSIAITLNPSVSQISVKWKWAILHPNIDSAFV